MTRPPLALTLALGIGFLTLSVGHGVAASPEPPPLLSSLEFPSNDLTALPQWERILNRQPDERTQIEQCDADIAACSSTKVVAWRAKVRQLGSAYPLDQLREVNHFVNAQPHRSDREAYDATDYWATPLAFIARSGDSEDFAIFKFFMLRELGFDNDQLRIVIAQDTLRNRPVALLAAYHGGQIYLLDDIADAVHGQKNALHYIPFYSVNETTRWAHLVNAKDPIAAAKEN